MYWSTSSPTSGELDRTGPDEAVSADASVRFPTGAVQLREMCLGGQINPYHPVPHFGLETPHSRPGGMRARTAIQVELPVMPRASHYTPGNLSGGEIPAGVGACVVDDDHPLRSVQPENAELPPVALDERTTAPATLVQRDQLNKRHGCMRQTGQPLRRPVHGSRTAGRMTEPHIRRNVWTHRCPRHTMRRGVRL